MKNLNFLTTWQYAHRGLHNSEKNIPENSLSAYQLAIQNGYGIELDIQADSNGTFFCFHDSNLKRMTNIDMPLKGLDVEQISNYKLLNSNETIPLFIDVLKLVNGEIPLLIEIKTHKNYKKTLFNFLKIMDQYHGEFAVFSFNPFIVKWLKKNKPTYIRGQITSYFTEKKKTPKLGKYLMKSLFFNKFTNPDFISYDSSNLPNKYALSAKNKGLVVISYTAQNQEQMDRALKYSDNIVFENFIPKKIE